MDAEMKGTQKGIRGFFVKYTGLPEQKYSLHSIYFPSVLTHIIILKTSCDADEKHRGFYGKNQSEKQIDNSRSACSQGLGLNGGAMQGTELLKNLAELDREFEKKLEDARHSADRRIASAQEKARRILNEAEIQIRQMEESSKIRITAEGEKLAAEAQARAEAEAEHIRRQAEPNIELAVSFILSEVLP